MAKNKEYEDFEQNNFEGMPKSRIKKKFWKFRLIIIFTNIALLIVAARLFYIQVLDNSEYKEKARRQHETMIKLKPVRGKIFDRNGNLLATDVKTISVAADPKLFIGENSADNKRNDSLKTLIITLLSEITGLDKSEFRRRIERKGTSFVWLVRGLEPSKAVELEKIKSRGLLLIEEPGRIYPYGQTACHVIGCTDIDNKGIAGIEKQFDTILQGSSGYMLMHKDALGYLRPSATLPAVDAIDGKNITLTIDINLQRIADYELKNGVEQYNAASGIVLAIKPKTGEILAMSSYPGFNPNQLQTAIQGSMKNRCISDIYEPGSTFKLITSAVALEEKLIKIDDIFDGYNGLLKYPEYTISDVHPIGEATFADAFKYSSNIIFAQVASKINSNTFRNYIEKFGFGIPTKCGLPGEVNGKVPKAAHINGVDKKFIGFGYGISSTPLQLLNAYAAVANGGVLMQPYCIAMLTDINGKSHQTGKPTILRKVISPAVADKLTELLVTVVDGGTGSNAEIKGLRIAGKTGTAQQIVNGKYSEESHTASFVGFLPAEKPELVMMVMLDKPKGAYYGGATSAPIFKNIVAKWLNIKSHEELSFAKNNLGVLIPNFIGLTKNDASELAKSLSLSLVFEGKGNYIKSQIPDKGFKKFLKQQKVKLTLGNFNISSNLIGLTLKEALRSLHLQGIKSRVIGSGRVVAYKYVTEEKFIICELYCN